MYGVSRRRLFSLIGGLGGLAVSGSNQSLAQTALPKPREERRRIPTDNDADVFEAVGRFEWFNLEDSFAVLREVDSERRIMVHVSCLRAAGIKKISIDTVYRCDVLQRPKVLQAFRISNVLGAPAV